MDLAKLQVFVRVADAGSLSKAAILCELDPSALSRQLSSLEAAFHGKLVSRTGRGVKLTALGERILPKVRALLEDARSLEAEIGEEAGVCSGTVRMACVPSVGSPLLIRLFRVLRERHPLVTLHVMEGLSSQVEQWLADGTIDLGFVLRANDPMEVPIAVSRLCLVGPPGDKLTLRKEIELQQIDGLPLLQPAASSSYGRALAQLATEAGVRLNIVAQVDSIQMQKDMVAAGIGYALLSMTSVLDELKANRLSATRIVRPEIVRPIYIGMPSRKPNLATREVARLIREVASGLAASGAWGDETQAV